MGSSSLIFRAPLYREGLQSLASTKSIVVAPDAWPFDYNGICPEFRCLFLNSPIHCIFCRNRCSEATHGSHNGERSGWLPEKYLNVG